MAEQNEKAFQKQPTVYAGHRRVIDGAKKRMGLRYVRKVGLGIKTPAEAVSGRFIDKKCPFTGNVSIRGRILKGTVRSHKMKRTIIIRRNFLHFIRKYNRFEKRHSNLSAHMSPAFRVNEGDEVLVGECRPLSKTVNFNVLAVTPKGGKRGNIKLFQKF